MHVVREEGASVARPAAGERPTVRPDRHRIGPHQSGRSVPGRGDAQGRERLGRYARGWPVRAYTAQEGLGVAVGIGGQERHDLGRQGGLHDAQHALRTFGIGQELDHAEDRPQAVGRGPGLGAVTGQQELEGEYGAAVDGRIHAGRVGREHRALRLGQTRQHHLGHPSETQHALLAVVVEGGFAEHLGQTAADLAPEEVHLKQALPCGDVAERQKGVFAAVGLDSGDADVVEADPDLGSQAG